MLYSKSFRLESNQIVVQQGGGGLSLVRHQPAGQLQEDAGGDTGEDAAIVGEDMDIELEGRNDQVRASLLTTPVRILVQELHASESGSKESGWCTRQKTL